MPNNDTFPAIEKGNSRDYKKLVLDKKERLLTNNLADANTFKAVKIDVTTTAKDLASDIADAGLTDFILYHKNTNINLYLGSDNTVTSSTGAPIIDGDTLSLTFSTLEFNLYGIAESGTITVYAIGVVNE